MPPSPPVPVPPVAPEPPVPPPPVPPPPVPPLVLAVVSEVPPVPPSDVESEPPSLVVGLPPVPLPPDPVVDVELVAVDSSPVVVVVVSEVELFAVFTVEVVLPMPPGPLVALIPSLSKMVDCSGPEHAHSTNKEPARALAIGVCLMRCTMKRHVWSFNTQSNPPGNRNVAQGLRRRLARLVPLCACMWQKDRARSFESRRCQNGRAFSARLPPTRDSSSSFISLTAAAEPLGARECGRCTRYSHAKTTASRVSRVTQDRPLAV